MLGAVGSPALRAAAAEAAERVIAGGVPDPDWAAAIGSPAVGQCWHYSDIGGQQESVTVSFGYGAAEHALSVLIDHGLGGKIKDAWVDDAAGLLDKTWLAAENDPLVVFEEIEPDDAGQRLARAVAAGECPVKPDETDDLTAHRALLHARVRYLTATASPPLTAGFEPSTSRSCSNTARPTARQGPAPRLRAVMPPPRAPACPAARRRGKKTRCCPG